MGSFISWLFPSWLWNKKKNKQKEILIENKTINPPKPKLFDQTKPTYVPPINNYSNNCYQSSYSSKDQRILYSSSKLSQKPRIINRVQLNIKQKQKQIHLRNRIYELTNDDAKKLSKQISQDQQLFSVDDCRREMKKQLTKLNQQYKYSFKFREEPHQINKGKKMTRTIYLVFQCQKCKQNRWTTIGGTFQITFTYKKYQSLLLYHLEIFKTQCRKCNQYMRPKTYKTQMEAMKIFFSSIITNIHDNKQPPQKPAKYYIRQNHWHKKQWCEACKLGRCTTQNRLK